MKREICKCCGEINRVGFSVPPEIWVAVVPTIWQKEILCLNCFTRFGDEAQVRWDSEIEFYPVSKVTDREELLIEVGRVADDIEGVIRLKQFPPTEQELVTWANYLRKIAKS